ncbi:MAG: T9SS type A sorting domain-containing protein [Bacteroidia bacterium]|nr:T9SS type A sorting domain-containing protein [Bacteroidia bacterium]
MSDGYAFANAYGGMPPYSYLWNNGATTQEINNLNGGTYCVTATEINGCTATDCMQVAYVCEPDFTDSIDLNCGPYCLHFYSASQSTSSIIACTWDFGDSSTDSGPDIIHTFPGTGTYTVCLTIETNGECSGTYCESVSIGNVNPCNMTVDYYLTECSDTGTADGAIDITVYGGNPPYSYNWSTGETTQDITGLVPGFYTITVTDSNGCDVTMTFAMGTAPVNIPVDTLWTNMLDTCINVTGYYIDSITVLDSSFVEVIWVIIENTDTLYQNIIYQYSQTGYIAVNLTLNCPGLKVMTVLFGIIHIEYDMILNAQNAMEYSGEILFYPNPVGNVLNISNLPDGVNRVTIFNITGQKMNEVITQSAGIIRIKTGNLYDGIYLLQIVSKDGQICTTKFYK